jgi:hypothetical protein
MRLCDKVGGKRRYEKDEQGEGERAWSVAALCEAKAQDDKRHITDKQFTDTSDSDVSLALLLSTPRNGLDECSNICGSRLGLISTRTIWKFERITLYLNRSVCLPTLICCYENFIGRLAREVQ